GGPRGFGEDARRLAAAHGRISGWEIHQLSCWSGADRRGVAMASACRDGRRSLARAARQGSRSRAEAPGGVTSRKAAAGAVVNYVEFMNRRIKDAVAGHERLVVYGQNVSTGSCLSGLARGFDKLPNCTVINTTNAESTLVGMGFGLMLRGISSIFF